MLSYKEYKLLNESLYGALNLGLRNPATVGGIVSQSGVSGTEAALEAQAEEAIEEAKKMKKKMEDEEAPEEEVEDKEGEEDSEEEGSEEKEENKTDDDAEGEDEDSEEDSDDEEEEEVEDEPKFMKKKAKKEWSEIVSDLEAILEDISDEGALAEIKKGLETIKEGMKKGCGEKMMDKKCGKMMDKKCGKYMSEGNKSHKSDCDCPVCEKKDEKDEDEGLTAAQKKLPKALQDAILAKKGKGEKKAEKKMNEEELAWWQSVHSMIGVQDQKGWDGGWSEIKDVATSLRDEERPV
jgi:hypothetical protein